MDMNSLELVEYCAWNWTTSRCWLFKNINFFAFYVNLPTIIHVHYMLLGVEGMAMRMAVREELSLLSGLIICEIVNSVGQGNFTFVRKKSENFRNHCLWQPCLMRGIYTVGVGVDLIIIQYFENNNESRHTWRLSTLTCNRFIFSSS